MSSLQRKFSCVVKQFETTADEKVNPGQPGGTKPVIRIFRKGGLSKRLEKYYFSG